MAENAWNQASIDPWKSLLIRDLSVVESPFATDLGPWSFSEVFMSTVGRYDRVLAGQILFRLWEQYEVHELNGYYWERRNPSVLLESWPRWQKQPKTLDIEQSPFLLLAILFRPDLATETSAGELRMVFGALEPVNKLKDLTLIFEYDLKYTYAFPDRESWLKAISELSESPFGIDYNFALKSLTDQVLPPLFSHSTFKHLRINEQLFGNGWDMRSFRFQPFLNSFQMETLQTEPDIGWNTLGHNELVKWAIDNQDFIIKDKLILPESFQAGRAFLPDNNYSWFPENPHMNADLIQSFNLKTCTGCHGSVTATRFMHIEPRLPGKKSLISPFLKKRLPVRQSYLENYDSIEPSIHSTFQSRREHF